MTRGRPKKEKPDLVVNPGNSVPVGKPGSVVFEPAGNSDSKSGASDNGNLSSVQAPVIRRRRKRIAATAPAVDPQTVGLLLRPCFAFVSMLMERRGSETLSDMEIDSGCVAFTPLVVKYLPSMEKYSVFVPPCMWIATVYLVRAQKKEEKKESIPEEGKTPTQSGNP